MGKRRRPRFSAAPVDVLLSALVLAMPICSRADPLDGQSAVSLIALATAAAPHSLTDLQGADESPAASQTGTTDSLLVDVEVNGVERGAFAVERLADGTFVASPAQLTQWGVLATYATEPLRLDGRTQAQFDEGAQKLSILLPPEMLPMKRLSATGRSTPQSEAAPGNPSDSAVMQTLPGLFIDYAAQIDRVGGRSRSNALLDVGTSVSGGTFAHSQSFQLSGGHLRSIRLDTSWTFDEPGRLRRTVIGDAIAPAGQWGKAIRFGGLRWGTDFSLRPDLVTFALPSIRGSAALPSTVDVLVNGQRVSSQQIDAGPFEIQSLPTVSGQGEVSVRVLDAMGRQQTIHQPYYTSATLLKQGLSQYAVSAGFLREHYLVRSDRYGEPFGMAQYREGLSADSTYEARAEASSRHAALGLGLAHKLGGKMIAQLALAASWQRDPTAHAPRDGLPVAVARPHEGGQLSAGVERNGQRWRFSVAHSRATESFVQLGDARLQFADRMPASRPRHSTNLFVGWTAGNTTIGVSHLVRRDDYGFDRFSSLNVSSRISNVAMLTAFVNHGAHSGNTIGLMVIIPTGPGSLATVNAQGSRDSRRLDTTYQVAPPSTQGYRMRVRASGPEEAAAATVSYQDRTALGSLDVAHDRMYGTSLRGYVSGSVVMADRHLVALRNDGSSIARVRVGDYPGIRVYLENREAGVTDKTGHAWIAGLRPYDRNRISVDTRDLPIDANVESLDLMLRPPPRTVVAASMPMRSDEPLYGRLHLPDRSSLPAHASVFREDGSILPTGANGEVIVNEARPGEKLLARWDASQCVARVPATYLEDQQALRRQTRAAHPWLALPCER